MDELRQEEIRLEKLWSKWGYREIWVSLDDVEDRTADDPVDITHLEIEANLTKCALFDRPDYAEFRATVTFTPLRSGCRAFTFQLPSPPDRVTFNPDSAVLARVLGR